MVEKKRKEEESRPEEFEEPELPTEAPPSPEEEFEEIDLETGARGIPSPTKELIYAKQQLEKRLLLEVTDRVLATESGTDAYGFENIVGVGISEKIAAGKSTGKPCVTVYVVAKKPKDMIEKEALVPDEINGIPTDVRAVGEIRVFPNKGRYRPAPGGVSIGHCWGPTGTMGCLVRRGRRLYILSNNHVIARSNWAVPGAPIIQPGRADGGTIKDTIAILSEFVPIKFFGPVNHVDCAIAQALPRLVTPKNKCFGKISADPVSCRLGTDVKKCGRTTQEGTIGRITDCNLTVRVYGYGLFGLKWALFQDQIVIKPKTNEQFSAPGDSGSLIITDAGSRPVGLLFAGSSSLTIANPITAVLKELKVTIYA